MDGLSTCTAPRKSMHGRRLLPVFVLYAMSLEDLYPFGFLETVQFFISLDSMSTTHSYTLVSLSPRPSSTRPFVRVFLDSQTTLRLPSHTLLFTSIISFGTRDMASVIFNCCISILDRPGFGHSYSSLVRNTFRLT